jgi:hypothetical protein
MRGSRSDRFPDSAIDLAITEELDISPFVLVFLSDFHFPFLVF